MMTHDQFDMLYNQLQETHDNDNPAGDGIERARRKLRGMDQQNFLHNQMQDTSAGKLKTGYVTPEEDRLIAQFLDELANAVEAADEGDRGPIKRMAHEMQSGKWKDFRERMGHVRDFATTRVIDPQLND
jgi:hypothetical protein